MRVTRTDALLALYTRISRQAESLYNDCQFEHAMTVFVRGVNIAPAFQGFITGMAKVVLNVKSFRMLLLIIKDHRLKG